jgi:hypothetical protein
VIEVDTSRLPGEQWEDYANRVWHALVCAHVDDGAQTHEASHLANVELDRLRREWDDELRYGNRL